MVPRNPNRSYQNKNAEDQKNQLVLHIRGRMCELKGGRELVFVYCYEKAAANLTKNDRQYLIYRLGRCISFCAIVLKCVKTQ